MCANAEVNEFTVVNGPSAAKLFEVAIRVNRELREGLTDIDEAFELPFTVTTKASPTPFPVTLRITDIVHRDVDGPTTFYLTTLFQGKEMGGAYDLEPGPKSERGLFCEL